MAVRYASQPPPASPAAVFSEGLPMVTMKVSSNGGRSPRGPRTADNGLVAVVTYIRQDSKNTLEKKKTGIKKCITVTSIKKHMVKP